MKRTILTAGVLLFFMLNSVLAQADDLDFMRSTGKIRVVVAIIIVIFLGIVLFLIFLERKLTKLENQIKEND